MIDSYNKMPIGLYFQLQALILAEPDDYEWKPKALALLTGKPEEALLQMPLPEFSALMRRAAFLVTPPQTERAKSAYKAGPFELVPTTDANKVTTAQYIDFQTFCKEENDEARVVNVLSCMLVPKGKKYCQDCDPGEVREAIRKHITVVDALSLYGFFFAQLLTSMRLSLTYSEKLVSRMQKMPATARRDREIKKAQARIAEAKKQMASINDGDGLRMLTPFQKLAAVLGMRFGL